MYQVVQIDNLHAMYYNTGMNTKHEYKNLRIYAESLQPLKLIAAMTGTSIIEVVDRLAREELQRLKEHERGEKRGTIKNEQLNT